MVVVRHRAIRKEIERLGTLQPDEIAVEMQEMAMYGATGNPYYCPLARYFKIIDGFKNDIVVSSSDVDINSKSYPLPPNVGEFVKRFDAEQYPELDIYYNSE